MKLRRYEQIVTTDGSGAASIPVGGLSDPESFTGRLYCIAYVKDSVNPYDAGVDFSIYDSTGIFPFWVEPNVNATKAVYPRDNAHDQAGDDIIFTASDAIVKMIPLISEGITIGITNGGASKAGTFHIIILDHFDFAGSSLL